MNRSYLNKLKNSKVKCLYFHHLGSQEQIRVKLKEHKNLKALSQMILDQRSDVEQFFLESLEQVKEEAKRKRAQDKSTNNAKFPDIDVWKILMIIE